MGEHTGCSGHGGRLGFAARASGVGAEVPEQDSEMSAALQRALARVASLSLSRASSGIPLRSVQIVVDVYRCMQMPCVGSVQNSTHTSQWVPYQVHSFVQRRFFCDTRMSEEVYGSRQPTGLTSGVQQDIEADLSKRK